MRNRDLNDIAPTAARLLPYVKITKHAYCQNALASNEESPFHQWEAITTADRQELVELVANVLQDTPGVLEVLANHSPGLDDTTSAVLRALSSSLDSLPY